MASARRLLTGRDEPARLVRHGWLAEVYLARRSDYPVMLAEAAWATPSKDLSR